MPAFFEYIRHITYYLVFASIVQAFAPLGKYKNFISLVMGFILLFLMIRPIAGLLRSPGVPVTSWFAGVPVTGVDNYSELWEAQLNDAFAVQLNMQLSRLLEGNGFVLYSADFSHTADFSQITGVSISAGVRSGDSPERVPFIRIKPPSFSPIRIGQAEEEREEACPHAAAIKNLVGDFYNLPHHHIHVIISY